jgi:hypothetical protein
MSAATAVVTVSSRTARLLIVPSSLALTPAGCGGREAWTYVSVH